MSQAKRSNHSLQISPCSRVGIAESTIHSVVHTFYARVRTDPALGPIFNRIIADNWDAHLTRMCDFWSSVLLMTGRFKGSPMQVHAAIGGLRSTHFVRWIHLFRQTVQEICSDESAALFINKAQIIGDSLLLGLESASPHRQSPATRLHQ